jgi:hypothetical protein
MGHHLWKLQKNWDYMVGACHIEDYWNIAFEEKVAWNL